LTDKTFYSDVKPFLVSVKEHYSSVKAHYLTVQRLYTLKNLLLAMKCRSNDVLKGVSYFVCNAKNAAAKPLTHRLKESTKLKVTTILVFGHGGLVGCIFLLADFCF